MTLTSMPVETFGGLNLIGDPEEVGANGAIDTLNVDLDKQGRARSRDGFDNLTASAAASRLDNIAAFYKVDGTKQVMVASNAGGFLRAHNTSGATVASQVLGSAILEADFTRFGGPSAEVTYFSGTNSLAAIASNVVYKWDGTTWSGAGGMVLGGSYPFALEVQANDNRMVGAFPTSNSSRVGFSGPGTPETFGANDYVDLTPGDGERITALVSWREMVFAFKETKFFVFAGNSTSGTGTSIFNYRPVSTGVGTVARQCATATPNGVFFLARRGIFKTTGADPVLVSRTIDPIFRGGASAFYLGGVLNHAAINKCQLAWHDNRLYFAYPSGAATTNDRLLVYDPETDVWLLWDVAANALASFRIGDQAELVFTYAAGSNHIGRLSSAYTSDDGTAITSRHRSGFYELAPGKEAFTRWTRVWGSGAPTVSVFTDHSSTDANAGAVTLGTEPATAMGYHLKSYAGRLFSHQFSASTAWRANRLQHDVASAR